MPLTIAHVAAVIPVRRLPIVLSAFVIGTMAPDFEYFVRLEPQSRWSHHFPGVFLFTLPCALLVLWLYHRLVKNAAIALLPQAIQCRLPKAMENFSFSGVGRLIAIVLSILGGIATHVVWDMFTHIDTPIYERFDWPSTQVNLPVIGVLSLYKILQYASSLGGVLALVVWIVLWCRHTPPVRQRDGFPRISGTWKFGVVSLMLVIAATAALVRAYTYAGMPEDRSTLVLFAGLTFATAVTALWVEMLVYGALWTSRNRPVLDTE